jgi:hypothetical protein
MSPEQALGKPIEKDPDLRYQTAADLRADLKRLRRDTTSGHTAVATVGAERRKNKVPRLAWDNGRRRYSRDHNCGRIVLFIRFCEILRPGTTTDAVHQLTLRKSALQQLVYSGRKLRIFTLNGKESHEAPPMSQKIHFAACRSSSHSDLPVIPAKDHFIEG